MTEYQQIYRTRHNVLCSLSIALKEAQSNAALENASATHMQRHFRGNLCRAKLTQRNRAQITIARYFRGHFDRMQLQFVKADREAMERDAHFHFFAIHIQKMYRGYFTRTHTLDFRKRKEYLQRIQMESVDMRSLLEKYKERQIHIQNAKKQEIAQHRLKRVTRDLHHLMSTSAIPGVFCNRDNGDTEAMETHIRNNSLAGIQNHMRQKSEKTLRPFPPSNKASIQASSSFDALYLAEKEEKKRHLVKRMGDRDFQTVFRVLQGKQEDTHLAGKMGSIRTVKRTQENCVHLPRITIPKKPFQTTTGGNKSRVYANDRFDV